jgi:hypothetical protein
MNRSRTGTLSLERIFPGDSELASLMRELDWRNTGLGFPENWPERWRTAVGLCLTSRIPVVMYLGPEFSVLYNDPYVSFLGSVKHPHCLGQPGQEVWREIWHTIGPMLASVYETGKATWSEDVQMFFFAPPAARRSIRALHLRSDSYGGWQPR